MRRNEALEKICPFSMNAKYLRKCETTGCMAWQMAAKTSSLNTTETEVDKDNGLCMLIPR